jgi:hypothetical protein
VFNSIITHLNFEAMSELDLILRKNEEARSLDVDHFHDMIRTARDDQILKVLLCKSYVSGKYHEHIPHQILGVPSIQLSQAIIALRQVFL